MATLSSHCRQRPSAFRHRAWLAYLEAADLLEVSDLPVLLSFPNISGEVRPVLSCDECPGCPESVHHKNLACDGVSSCLESRILRRYQFARPGSPPCIAVPVAPPNEVASCPASCIFRLCRRWNFELPRTSHPSTHPAVKFQVSLQLRCA